MSIQHICDGCKRKVDEPICTGNVLKRDYCEPCGVKAGLFLAAEEHLRVDLVSKYNKNRLALIQKFSEKEFYLPDVVYE